VRGITLRAGVLPDLLSARGERNGKKKREKASHVQNLKRRVACMLRIGFAAAGDPKSELLITVL